MSGTMYLVADGPLLLCFYVSSNISAVNHIVSRELTLLILMLHMIKDLLICSRNLLLIMCFRLLTFHKRLTQFWELSSSSAS